jgi:hypothetical protein
MRLKSKNGVVTFTLEWGEKINIEGAFFNNKTFLGANSELLEVWGFNYDVPSLLIGGKVYFGVKAKRDFYSNSKEDIYKELGVFEREEGIFAFESYNAGKTLEALIYPQAIQIKGYAQVGDKIGKNKIKNLAVTFTGYFEGEGIMEGVYDF